MNAINTPEQIAAAAKSNVETLLALANAVFNQTERLTALNLNTARAAADDGPDDVDSQLLVADLDVSGGHVQDAFDRLIELVKRLDGDDRDRVRERLLELFTVVGVTDPRVATARRALATALF